jgi:nifR3 family TIM-barrel protein
MLPTATRIRDVVIAPNVILAPMEGVTDLTFRRLVRQIGGAGLTCTEFIPSAGLAGVRNDAKALKMAAFDPDERPISVQIYGKDPAIMAEAARVVEGLGATICDINMGCPSKKVCKNSGGSALMRDLDLAIDIVRAVRAAITIPLTVKMRSGFDAGSRNAPELAWRCEQEGVEGLTIHWRTRADLYGGERQVDKIREAKDRVTIPVIGNGDVIDPASALRMLADTGCDGVMVGRGAMRNPWSLLQITQTLRGEPLTHPTPAERERVLLGYLDAMRARARTDQGALGRFKRIANHFTRGLPHGSELLRTKVLRSQDVDEAVGHVHAYFRLLERHEAGEQGVFDAALAAR